MSNLRVLVTCLFAYALVAREAGSCCATSVLVYDHETRLSDYIRHICIGQVVNAFLEAGGAPQEALESMPGIKCNRRIQFSALEQESNFQPLLKGPISRGLAILASRY